MGLQGLGCRALKCTAFRLRGCVSKVYTCGYLHFHTQHDHGLILGLYGGAQGLSLADLRQRRFEAKGFTGSVASEEDSAPLRYHSSP